MITSNYTELSTKQSEIPLLLVVLVSAQRSCPLLPTIPQHLVEKESNLNSAVCGDCFVFL